MSETTEAHPDSAMAKMLSSLDEKTGTHTLSSDDLMDIFVRGIKIGRKSGARAPEPDESGEQDPPVFTGDSALRSSRARDRRRKMFPNAHRLDGEAPAPKPEPEAEEMFPNANRLQ